uniref:Uncharacterized protein n=2 Tax=Lepeophtheirus salmonis TaxID=72036 RepID=A0A0K2VKM6_LEPSM
MVNPHETLQSASLTLEYLINELIATN